MCVKINILGINHNDPLGKQKTVALLKGLKKNGYTPDCIATEWDKDLAQSIIEQRNKFIKYVKDEIPYLNNKTIESLANAMAYEADSHMSLYPNLPIIWLDKGSKYFKPIDCYWNDRLDIYLDNINQLDDKDKNNLEILSKNIWNIANSENATERDEKFFEIILNTIDKGYKNILVIVGASHANIKINKSLASLLLENKLSTQTYILNVQSSI